MAGKKSQDANAAAASPPAEARRTAKRTTNDGSKEQEQNASKEPVDEILVVGQPSPLLPAGEHLSYITTDTAEIDFNLNCQPLTLEHLVRKERDRDDTEDQAFNDITDIKALITKQFLFVMLIGLSRAKTDASAVQITGFNKRGKRNKREASYSYKYLFASLNDRTLLTCVILEQGNDHHNLLWQRNKGKRGVRVGSKFAIQNPRAIGFLPTRSVIVETKLPLLQLTGPAIKPAPIIANSTSHVMKYFVIKKQSLRFDPSHLPVPWKTTCNADYCDRLEFTEKNNINCGCWGQNSKNDSSARNVLLQFDLLWRKDEVTYRIVNFTSLRTSRIFFRDERIVGDFDTLATSRNIQVIRMKFLQTLNFINDNGGWTIVGWYIRGEKTGDDSKEDNEEHMLSENVKYNVAYLYPTVAKHESIPTQFLFGDDDLHVPVDALADNETDENHNH